MAKASRDKGARFERQIVNDLQALGLGAEKMPLSGALGGRFGGDISVPVQREDWRGEAKCRADGQGFKTIYDWIWGNRLLFLKKDRQRTLVVMHLEDFAHLARLDPVALDAQLVEGSVLEVKPAPEWLPRKECP